MDSILEIPQTRPESQLRSQNWAVIEPKEVNRPTHFWHWLTVIGLRQYACYVLFLATAPLVPGPVAAAAPLRPVIFVPGILGSKLCDSKGHVLWGNSRSLMNLTSLSLERPNARTDISSCGIITEIQILGPVWAIHQYDGLLASLHKLGFREGENFFIFDYDWRLSNFDNAKKLAEFIRQKLPGNASFNLVAHSMGGIITRIYLHDAGAQAARTNMVFYMGTPFLGSGNTFGAMSSGWGPLDVMAGGKDSIRRAILSFPSFLELLPRYKNCCYVREASGDQRFLDIFQVSTWKSLGWLPGGKPDYTDDEVFATALSRASTLDEYMTKPVSSSIREVKVAGDAHTTKYNLGMPWNNTRPDAWIFTPAGGDGTVPKWSAAQNISQDSLAGSLQSFEEHATIFNDKWVQNELARELTNTVPPKEFMIAGPGSPTVRVVVNEKENIWMLKTVSLIPDASIVGAGDQIKADLVLEFNERERLAQNVFRPTAMASLRESSEVLMVDETTSTSDLQRHRLRYSINGYQACAPGVVEIVVDLGSLTEHGYVAVLPKDEK